MLETKKVPNPIDIHVGGRIRLRRNMLKMSQEKLGEKLGITFQQVQKYEKGTNRVGASRLQAISEIMDVPVSYFFDQAPTTQSDENSTKAIEDYHAFCTSNEGLQLMRAFTKISDPKVRRRIIELAKVLSEEQDLKID